MPLWWQGPYSSKTVRVVLMRERSSTVDGPFGLCAPPPKPCDITSAGIGFGVCSSTKNFGLCEVLATKESVLSEWLTIAECQGYTLTV